jgi:hypothetical protein
MHMKYKGNVEIGAILAKRVPSRALGLAGRIRS